MVKISWEKLGRNIRAERERQGMSVEELARRVGETTDYVIKAESGKRRLTLAESIAFYEALGVTSNKLFAGIEE
ncbi:MAG: helix-turn-helix transcriptional regulator [Clostridia bacterium]|nr:helix-turn-helix transcriptional regulator [Clostridia bacterium]